MQMKELVKRIDIKVYLTKKEDESKIANLW